MVAVVSTATSATRCTPPRALPPAAPIVASSATISAAAIHRRAGPAGGSDVCCGALCSWSRSRSIKRSGTAPIVAGSIDMHGLWLLRTPHEHLLRYHAAGDEIGVGRALRK